MLKLFMHLLVGIAFTLLSTFVGERSARATYPDIMGCETGCNVVATGWPLVFVRDYLGMSVGNRADIPEVWLAADRFDWMPFLLNIVAWSLLSAAVYTMLRRALAPWRAKRGPTA